MNNKKYPLHSSFVNCLKTVDAPLVALRLVRKIISVLEISQLELEIVLGMMGKLGPSEFDDICEIAPHLDKDRVKRILNMMKRNHILDFISADNDHGYVYAVKPVIEKIIVNVSKESLE